MDRIGRSSTVQLLKGHFPCGVVGAGRQVSKVVSEHQARICQYTISAKLHQQLDFSKKKKFRRSIAAPPPHPRRVATDVAGSSRMSCADVAGLSYMSCAHVTADVAHNTRNITARPVRAVRAQDRHHCMHVTHGMWHACNGGDGDLAPMMRQ
ncbi:calmodulin-binding family protein [Dorcoceras hygrometricum]|uniref:Calmodulin-binding family protein n=1 Tax=Dorcoceras hygrometricum TaxID=472368 RepID=A0A2Z7B0S9_9LAMI|nr:calmodulin-binding family protein [Dorcoceras hygrometricum]